MLMKLEFSKILSWIKTTIVHLYEPEFIAITPNFTINEILSGEYMAFGLSGNPSRTQMIGGDVTVAWMDHNTGKGYAEDYYLDAKSQCAGTRGSCPDSNLALGRNDVKLLNSAIINEFTMLTYRRPLDKDDQYDSAILTNQSQAVIWAMGPINSKV